MPKATAICNSIVNIMYRAVAWANVADNAATAPLTLIFIALHTAGLTAGVGLQNENEIAYTNYTREDKGRNTTDWSAPSGGSTSNATVINLPQCGLTGGVATTTSTGIGASGATPVWHYGSLNASLAIANGITPQFEIGAYIVQET